MIGRPCNECELIKLVSVLSMLNPSLDRLHQPHRASSIVHKRGRMFVGQAQMVHRSGLSPRHAVRTVDVPRMPDFHAKCLAPGG